MLNMKTVDVGAFEVTSGVVICSDPCYERGTWCARTVPAAVGTWRAEVVTADCGDWGTRVVCLRAFLVDAPRPELTGSGWELGVDSGQLGFFDAAAYPIGDRGDFDDAESFYGRCCAATCGEGACGYGVVPGGVVSSSGYGDGGYPLRVGFVDGRAVSLAVEFISDGGGPAWDSLSDEAAHADAEAA